MVHAGLGVTDHHLGDPADHPLRGIEQTRWNPAWAQSLQQLIDRLQVTLQQMRVAADGLVASLGLNEVADDTLLHPAAKHAAARLVVMEFPNR